MTINEDEPTQVERERERCAAIAERVARESSGSRVAQLIADLIRDIPADEVTKVKPRRKP